MKNPHILVLQVLCFTLNSQSTEGWPKLPVNQATKRSGTWNPTLLFPELCASYPLARAPVLGLFRLEVDVLQPDSTSDPYADQAPITIGRVRQR